MTTKNKSSEAFKNKYFGRHMAAALILTIGILLTYLINSLLSERFGEEAQTSFNQAFNDRVDTISLTLDRKIQVLNNVGGLFQALENPSFQQFKEFTQSQFSQLEGIQTLEWIPLVNLDEKESFEPMAKRLFPTFSIQEESSNGEMVPVLEREQYYPVFFLEPIKGNEAVIGFDLASNQTRKVTLEKSRDTGKIIATHAISLVQENGDEREFLIFTPIYNSKIIPQNLEERRRTIKGFILGVFKISDIIKSAMKKLEPRGINFEVLDVSDPNDFQTLYYHQTRRTEPSPQVESDKPLLLEAQKHYDIANRKWSFKGTGNKDYFLNGESKFQTQIVYVFGILASIFASVFIFILMRGNDDIKQLVKIRTSELNESQGRLKAIFDNVVDGIITINKHGIIQSINPATSAMFGYETEEIIGQNIEIFTPYKEVGTHDKFLKNYFETGIENVINRRKELIGKRKDNTLFPIELAVSKLQFEDELFFLGIIRDITRRKQSDRLKEEFISNVSHELRTPLTIILGYLPLLTDKNKLPSGDKIAQFATKIQSSGQHLLSMVNDLLDFSKLEAGHLKLNLEILDAKKIIDGICNDLSETIKKKELSLEVSSTSCLIKTDQTRLKQILTNLAFNAIKFTPSGTIKISLIKDQIKNVALFSIKDTGIGIKERDQKTILQRFNQGDGSQTREYGGAGLGLPISKDLIELLGGEIWFESQDKVGTTFYFTIPLAHKVH